ncbi:MAG: Coenzyme F420 hydrogenase/dehydrogenase, beta subunit C-terminal domain [Clostridium sp.]|nr:Coenzyme F420 hydrogenase/dehydrogenase, beta subunit C-terminal domain [Clostridium sp.]MDU7084337.1 Coenzyme F420 hydrogenase/dehydrogenase, beta subunit C-terminal domain [Clostridium sp.]
MIVIKNKIECSGCYACANICPKNCISMTQDDEGFWYPKVDKKKCINCDLCVKVCPIINDEDKGKYIKSEYEKKVYAARNLDSNIRLNSSSGGVFTLLAEEVLNNDGIVIGAAFNEKFEVNHQIIRKKEDLNKVRGSKYVQSKIGDIYKEVRVELEKEKLVLFTGTPCQIEGLKNFLNKNYENLITQDIICHGVPSPLVWNQYLKFIGKKSKSKIESISFRSKNEGWRLFSLAFKFKDKFIAKNIEEDFYLIAFQNNIDLRPSCYACKAKGEIRLSDITLADFWGIENSSLKVDDNKGTSLVILNTIKGKIIFEKISKYLELEETNLRTATYNNKSYYISASRNINRENFLSEINEINFEEKVRQYCNYTYMVEFKKKTKKYLKKILQYMGLMKIVNLIRKGK